MTYGYSLAFNIPQFGDNYDLTVGDVTVTNDANVGNDLEVEHDITGVDGITFDESANNPGAASTLWVDSNSLLRLGDSVVGAPAGIDGAINWVQVYDNGKFNYNATAGFAKDTLNIDTLRVGFGDSIEEIPSGYTIYTNGNTTSRISNVLFQSNQIHPVGATSLVVGSSSGGILALEAPGGLVVEDGPNGNVIFRVYNDGLGTITKGLTLVNAQTSNPDGDTTIWSDGTELYFGNEQVTNQSVTVPGSLGYMLKSAGDGSTINASSNIHEYSNVLMSTYGVCPYTSTDYMMFVDDSVDPPRLMFKDNGSAFSLRRELWSPSAGGTVKQYVQLSNTGSYGKFAADTVLYNDYNTHTLYGTNANMSGDITTNTLNATDATTNTLTIGSNVSSSSNPRLIALNGDNNAVELFTSLPSSSYSANIRVSVSSDPGKLLVSSSSLRYKTFIKEVNGLGKAILKLEPASYYYKDDIQKYGRDLSLRAAGLIAEDVYAANKYFASYIMTKDVDKYPNALVHKTYETGESVIVNGLNEAAIIAGLVDLAQTQQKRIVELENTVERLQNDVIALDENVKTNRRDIKELTDIIRGIKLKI